MGTSHTSSSDELVWPGSHQTTVPKTRGAVAAPTGQGMASLHSKRLPETAPRSDPQKQGNSQPGLTQERDVYWVTGNNLRLNVKKHEPLC